MQQERKRSAVGELEARRLVEKYDLTHRASSRRGFRWMPVVLVRPSRPGQTGSAPHPVENARCFAPAARASETAGGGVSDGGVGWRRPTRTGIVREGALSTANAVFVAPENSKVKLGRRIGLNSGLQAGGEPSLE